MSLVECRTAAEVRANTKAVLARRHQWKEQERPVVVPPVVKVEIPKSPQEKFEMAIEVIMAMPTDNILSVRHPTSHPTMKTIAKAVCARYQLTHAMLVSKRRERIICRPRQMVAYLARKLTPRTLPEIGRFLGGRDHTTTMHSCRQIERLRALDEVLSADLDALELEIQLAV